MRDPLLFLQCIAKMMEELDISCEFDRCPPLDREFWDKLGVCQQNDDRRRLELIALCLREDTSDSCCIEKIIHLLEEGGFSTAPRHDFG